MLNVITKSSTPRNMQLNVLAKYLGEYASLYEVAIAQLISVVSQEQKFSKLDEAPVSIKNLLKLLEDYAFDHSEWAEILQLLDGEPELDTRELIRMVIIRSHKYMRNNA